MINLCLRYEKQMLEAIETKYVLPICLVTGFLGAGKTTLVQNLLRNRGTLKIGVFVNDVAQHNMDESIFAENSPDELKGLGGGCVCCELSVNTKFQADIWEILQRQPGIDNLLDYLIIETSGATDPTTIISTLDQRFGKMTRARLDCVVTVVDVDNLVCELETSNSTSSSFCLLTYRRQIFNADVVVLNKMDLIANNAEKCALARSFISSINPSATMLTAAYGQVPLATVLNIIMTANSNKDGIVSHEVNDDRIFVSTEEGKLRKPRLQPPSSSSSEDHHNHHHHLESDAITSFTFRPSFPHTSLSALQAFLHSLRDWKQTGRIVRCKGWVKIHQFPRQKFLFNVSGRGRVSLEAFSSSGVDDCSLVVVIIGIWLLQSDLETAVETLSSSSPLSSLSLSRYMSPESNLNKFDICSLHASSSESTLIPLIRLTCLKEYWLNHVTEDELKLIHVVDLDGANRNLANRLNLLSLSSTLSSTSIGGILACPLNISSVLWKRLIDHHDDDDVAVVASDWMCEPSVTIVALNSLDALRLLLCESAEECVREVVAKYFGHMKFCACG